MPQERNLSMKCGHCQETGPQINVAHVKACASFEKGLRSIGVAASLAAEPEEGVFVKEGVFYKVQQSPNTGNFYAKAWVERLHGGEWEYQGRKPLHSLTATDRVTAEQAARFGAVTGSCVFCSRKLTDERSIEVGYGAICAEHNGLPWGEVANA